MKSRHLLITLFVSLLTLTYCSKEDPKPNGPSITSFTPASGIVGATVTITGTNFSSASANEVKFNGTVATVTAATSTILTTTVPAGATDGKITISVNGATATSATDFVVTTTTITSFSPASGNALFDATPATAVIITGTNFSTTAANNTVKFNSTTATVTAATTTQLTVAVPTGASTGKITVTANSLTATSATDFVVNIPPTITSFSPASGNALSGTNLATTVIITGTNFSTTAANNTVKFNNTTASVAAASATQLTATVPIDATTGKITATVNGLTATSATDFVVNMPPAITSFSPAYSLPGATVTIIGTNFSATPGNNTVTINGASAIVNTATATQLTVSVPAAASTGKISVTVSALNGLSTNDFEVLKDFPRTGLEFQYLFNNNFEETPVGSFTLSGTATFTQDRFSRNLQALNFDGTQSCGIPGRVVQNTPYTISVWINYTAISGTKGIMSSMLNGNGLDIILSPVGTGYIIEMIGRINNATPVYMTSSFAQGYLGTSSNGWINFTMTTGSNNTNTIYVDGVVKDLNTIGDQGGLTYQFLLGLAQGANFNGKMDDLLFYTRALSAQEVMQLYEQTVSKY